MRKSNHEDPARKLQVGGLFLINYYTGRIFWRTIRKLNDADGDEFASGDSVVDEGLIVGNGKTLDELRNRLRELCRLKLDSDLHGDKGVSSRIIMKEFFHN